MNRAAATYSRRLPDLLSGARILLIPVLTIAALAGNGRLVGFGLLLAGATDFLDGYLARRLGAATPRGARLDALADNLLLVSTLAWLLWLHPDIFTTNGRRSRPHALTISAAIGGATSPSHPATYATIGGGGGIQIRTSVDKSFRMILD